MTSPTSAQIADFIQKVQMNMDFGHYDFIDEHISLFMLNPTRFSPLYIMAFLQTALPKRQMIKNYNLVLDYAKTIFTADQLSGIA